MHPNGVSIHPIAMEDRELYRRILGIESPWSVTSVDLQLTPKEVHIYLAHEDLPTWPCAECAAPSKLYDHQPERLWRHLDTCQFRTILHADPPRSQCPTHVCLAESRQPEGCGRATGAELGRSPRHHGPGRQARTGTSASRTHPPSGSG